MKSNFFSPHRLLGTLGILLLSFQGLEAQEPNPASESSGNASSSAEEPVLGESAGIVFTAARTEESEASAVGHLTVITAEDIAESGENSVVAVLNNVAGINFRSYSSEAQAEVSMRGFGENSSGRVLVLVDGKRLNNPDMAAINWLSVPLGDIERIEVLRGASSVLYGNNAVGGVINIITKKSYDPLKVNTSVSVGSYWANREEAGVSLAKDGVGLSVGAEHFSTDGYRDRSGFRSSQGSLKGNLALTPDFELSAGLSLADIFYEMPGGLTEAQFKGNPRQAVNQSDEAREYNVNADLRADWYLSEAVQILLPVQYGYKQVEADMLSFYSVWTPNVYSNRFTNTFETRPQINAHVDFGGPSLRLVGGADVTYARLSSASYATKDRSGTGSDYGVEQTTLGPYLSARLDILKNLGLEAGLRYDVAFVKAAGIEATHQAFVYEAGVNFQPLKEMKTYLRYGTLFRYPFTDEQVSTYDGSFTALNPETGFNFEGGIGLYFGKNLNLDLSAYYMELQDEIAWDSVNSVNANLDRTRRLGFDVEVSSRPIDLLRISASYSFVDARFAAGADEGKFVPLVPQHKVTAGLDVVLPFGLSFGPNISYNGAAFAGGDTSNSQTQVSDYFLLGAKARLSLTKIPGDLSVLLSLDNILDLSYAAFVYWGAYYPAPGRTFSVSLTYRY